MKQAGDTAPRMEKKQKTLGNTKKQQLNIEKPDFYHGYMTLRKPAFSFSCILNPSHSYSNDYFYLIPGTAKNLSRILLHLLSFFLFVTVVIHFGSTSILNCRRHWNYQFSQSIFT